MQPSACANFSSNEERMSKWKVFVTAAFISIFSTPSFSETLSVPDVVFVPIPGGSFLIGDERGDLWKSCRPVHSVTVSDFMMSETEITNAQYCVFLNDALARKYISVKNDVVKGNKSAHRGENLIHLSDKFTLFPGNQCRISFSRKDGFHVEPEYENWPVVCVTWYGAKAFADFYKWDLPREAEW